MSNSPFTLLPLLTLTVLQIIPLRISSIFDRPQKLLNNFTPTITKGWDRQLIVEESSKILYDFEPWTESKVDTKNF